MYKRIKTKIEHATFRARMDEDGNILSYRISPNEGYKLHEITLDEAVLDENGIETGEVKQGFTTSYITAGVNYDFTKNERQIYVVEI
jgi:hypothetical protein